LTNEKPVERLRSNPGHGYRVPAAPLFVEFSAEQDGNADEAGMNANVNNGSDRPYRGLLLDFGTVIQKSFFETRADLEKLLRLPAGTLVWAGPFDPASDRLWQQVVTGEFPERDYWGKRARDVGRLIGEEWTIQDFCKKHGELPPGQLLRPEMLKLIADVKRDGLKFGILSNELELFHGEGWLASMPFAEQVDGVVDATHTHILKPDPRAYALALETLDLAAAEVVFIDDQPRNVAGGTAAGIRSLHLDLTDPHACIREARLVLGL
jgi:putative hydrolase of the HAD superfamily